MLSEIIKQIKTSLIFLLIFTVLTGLIYPLLITAVAQIFLPWQANGSLLYEGNKVIGSNLIGQSFGDSPAYFWGRPSATTPYPYNGANSSGSNLGPSNPDYLASVQQRVKTLHLLNANQLVPVDLVTSSGSGLDPDISPLAAFYQVHRIANANHLSEQQVNDLIIKLIQNRTFAILGEPRVNVLELNIALKELRNTHEQSQT